MVRNAMRKELASLLTAPAESRPAVIRRSREPEWLYATDLPVLYEGSIPETVLNRLNCAGWETLQTGNWLQLKKDQPEPPEDWYTGPFGTEAACCRSLLNRHTHSSDEPSDDAQRLLIKAGETDGKTYENACRILHHDWAERLRLGRSLPDLSPRYFGQ